MNQRILAIVPAAGRSRRMGVAKQWLEIDGRPMLLGVIDALRSSLVHETTVVTHGDIARRIESHPDLKIVLNDDPDTEMIDSIRIALRHSNAKSAAGILVYPADQPGISASDINACISAFNDAPAQIVIARHAARRGHPLIFPASDIPLVESSLCDRGLNALPRSAPRRIRYVDCYSVGVIRDLDTPEDITRLHEARGDDN